MILVRLNRRPGALVTLACAVVIVAALYATLATPLDPDILTARGLAGRLVVTAVAFNGPAQVDGVVPGDLLAGQTGRGAAHAWVFHTPGGAHLILAAPPLTALSVLVVVLGGSLLLLGVVVLARSPDRASAAAFWRLSLLLAAALSLYPAAEHGLPWVLTLHFVVLRLCGPALLELALVFPTGTHSLARRSLLRLLLWLPALAVLPLYRTIVADAHGELAWVPELVLAAYVVGAAVRLLWSCFHARTALQRAQLYALAVGLLGGLAPPMLLTLVPQLLVGRPLVPADVTLLALGALPLGVGLAIARVELFGIAVRRRTRWLLRRVALPAGVAGAVGGVGLCLPAIQDAWRPLLPLLDAALVAAVALAYYAHRVPLQRPRLPAVTVSRPSLLAEPTAVGGAPGGSAVRGLSTTGLLTRRETEVLAYAAQGLHTPQIAARLHVSERTMESHFRQVFLKLEVHTRPAAVRVALENGLLPDPLPEMPAVGTPQPAS